MTLVADATLKGRADSRRHGGFGGFRAPRIDALLPYLLPVAAIARLAARRLGRAGSPTGFMPSPLDVALAFWDKAASGELATNIAVSGGRALAGLAHRRLDRLPARPGQRCLEAVRATDRHDAADDQDDPQSGADPAGHPVVRHRRGSQAVPHRARACCSRSTSTRSTACAASIRQLVEMGRAYGMNGLTLFRTRDLPGRAAVDLRGPAVLAGHHVADADRRRNRSRPRRASATWPTRRASS